MEIVRVIRREDEKVDKYRIDKDKEYIHRKVLKIEDRYKRVFEEEKLYKESISKEEDFEGYINTREDLDNIRKMIEEEEKAKDRIFMPKKNKIIQMDDKDEDVREAMELTTRYMVERGYLLPNWIPQVYVMLFKTYYLMGEDDKKFVPVYRNYVESLTDINDLIDDIYKNSLEGWEPLIEVIKEYKDDDTKIKTLIFPYYTYLEEYLREVLGKDWGSGNKSKIIERNIEDFIGKKDKSRITEYEYVFFKSLLVSIKSEYGGNFYAKEYGEGVLKVDSIWLHNRNTIAHGRIAPEDVQIEEVYSVILLINYLHEYMRYMNGEDIRRKKIHSLFVNKKIDNKSKPEEKIIFMRGEGKQKGTFKKPFTEGDVIELKKGNNNEEIIRIGITNIIKGKNRDKVKDFLKKNYNSEVHIEKTSYIAIVSLAIYVESGKKITDIPLEMDFVDKELRVIKNEDVINYIIDKDVEYIQGFEGVEVRTGKIFYVDMTAHISKKEKGVRVRFKVGDNTAYLRVY